MTNKRIVIITFSPGKSTSDIADAALVLLYRRGYNVDSVDITKPEDRATATSLEIHADMILVVTPVYFNNIPEPVEEFLRSAQLFAPRSDLILCYGSCGIGAAAEKVRAIMDSRYIPLYRVITVPQPHSLAFAADTEQLLPDSMAKVGRFLLDITAEDEVPDGSAKQPQLQPVGIFSKLFSGRWMSKVCVSLPATDTEKCVFCDRCADICPTGAVIPNKAEVDREICIRCAACVNVCPEGAKSMKVNPLYTLFMKQKFGSRPVPEEITYTKEEAN